MKKKLKPSEKSSWCGNRQRKSNIQRIGDHRITKKKKKRVFKITIQVCFLEIHMLEKTTEHEKSDS